MRRGLRRTSRGEIWTLEWIEAGPNKPWLHFLHATGMNAELYRPLLAPLAGDFNIVASDARGHGRTVLSANPAAMTGWTIYQDDLAAVLGSYPRAAPWLLAGHSLGATVTLELAARRPELARAVMMVEPAAVPFAHAAAFATARAGGALDSPMAAQARRRRRDWPSRGELRAAYRGRGVFGCWGDDWLDAYLDGGTVEHADGSVSLACDPAWEAATFDAVSTTLAASLAAWRGPLALLYGNSGSTVAPADVPVFIDGPARHSEYFEQSGHFLPVEQAVAVAAAIRALA